jgi:hypothetical protein
MNDDEMLHTMEEHHRRIIGGIAKNQAALQRVPAR